MAFAHSLARFSGRFSALLLLCVFGVGAQVAAQDIDLAPYISQNDPTLALKLFAQLNDWRIQEGHAPFQSNPILTEMAIEQAAFVRYQDVIGDIETYHIDQFGTSPRVRAFQRFGWQPFGNPDQIEIGENAGIGTINFALDYWRNSEIHRRAALSDIYREAGVAAIPNGKTDAIFIAVFGARPNVLPITFDPRDAHYVLNTKFDNFVKGDRFADCFRPLLVCRPLCYLCVMLVPLFWRLFYAE